MVRKSAEDGCAAAGELKEVPSTSSMRPMVTINLRDALLNTLSEAIAAINPDGRIVEMNEAWKHFQQDFFWLGEVLVFDETALKDACHDADVLIEGLHAVIGGVKREFEREFSVLLRGRPIWFRLRVKRLSGYVEEEGMHTMVSLRDITDRHRAEQDLHESHTLFQRVLEGTGDGIFIYDLEGRFLLHNSAAAEQLGFNKSPVVGKKVEEVFSPELARTVHGQNQLVLSTGRTLGYELVVGRRTLLVRKGVYLNHQNEAVGIIGIARDITERKRVEEKLERSERHFRALIERSADCIFLISQAGDILYASPSIKVISGYEAVELVGSNRFFWIHPEDVSSVQQQLGDLLDLPGASISGEFRHLCKDGNWKWLEATSTNWLHDPGVQAIVINARDVSKRKEDEQKLHRFKAIVESSVDGILSVDLNGKVTSWNPAAQRIFGYSEKEMMGNDFRILIPEDRLGEASKLLNSVLLGKEINDFETVRIGRGGRRVDVALTLSPIYSQDYSIAGITAIVRDITERRRLEKQVLEISDFEKRRIGQDLHDDLCQHLVGISIIGNLLHADLAQLGIKQADDAKQITEMIRNAVDHARILAKGLSPLNIAQGGLMAGLETLAANTEQMFRIPCRFECSDAVHIQDVETATHLFRIAQEALHNAVKHSKGTLVIIRLEADQESVIVTVSDNGVGISEVRKPSAVSGLGMHTMYYRARLIGATLEISKNPKGGTCVVCRLPKQKI